MRLILDSYIRERSCVTWNLRKSLYFSIHNGVKQGGVISPIFFNLYLDPMLIRLRESRIGCHILPRKWLTSGRASGPKNKLDESPKALFKATIEVGDQISSITPSRE